MLQRLQNGRHASISLAWVLHDVVQCSKAFRHINTEGCELLLKVDCVLVDVYIPGKLVCQGTCKTLSAKLEYQQAQEMKGKDSC